VGTADRRILLVATTLGYQIRSFGEAASKLGVQLVFVSDRCDRLEDPWADAAIPVRFHEQTRSVAAVVSACGDNPPNGIVAVGDRPAVLAAHLATAFGLPGHSPQAAAISRNKLLTRRMLQEAGLPTPWFASVSIESGAVAGGADVPFPAVVKPLALSGSRGVVRVNDMAEYDAAIARLQELLKAPDVRVERDAAHGQAVVEAFIPGAEYAIEGLLSHGVLRILAIFDKPDPLDGPFFEETIYRTPSVATPDVQQRIATAVTDAVRAIGLHHGPVHAECRVNEEGVYVLEVAARPIGGICSRALRFRPGHSAAFDDVSLEEVLLRHALGEDVSGYAREPRASGVMMIPIPRRGIYRRVEGEDAALAVIGVGDVRITAKPDAPIVPLPEGRSYLGFIFANATEPSAVDRTLREAHGCLHFVIDRDVTVVPQQPLE
jgi:formate-dependent phosphoribosylglycinamide formyltransferase (GAR transformylase)